MEIEWVIDSKDSAIQAGDKKSMTKSEGCLSYPSAKNRPYNILITIRKIFYILYKVGKNILIILFC